MAHNLEIRADGTASMFVVGEPAWHRLGTVLPREQKLTSAEAIEHAGLDWLVEKKEMIVKGSGVSVPDMFANVRNTDGAVLGVVGNRYTALQNKDAFDFFDPLVEDGIAKYESAGALSDGRRVWILAKLVGDPLAIGSDNDTVERYVLLSNSHDGKSGVVGAVTPVRVVCNNTLTAALQDYGIAKAEGNGFKLRHTSSVGDRIKRAQNLLKAVNEAYDKLAEGWNRMYDFKMEPEALDSYFKSVIPDPTGVENPRKAAETRAQLHLLAQSGAGANLPGVRGTLWGAVNAVTAFTSHQRSTRKGSSEAGDLESLWFGNRAEINMRAFEIANQLMAA